MIDDQKERWRSQVRAQLAAATMDAADRVKIQHGLASDALKALLLANGGAMIALFSFIGNVLAKAPATVFDRIPLRWAFGFFVAGFTLALIAHVLAFLSQDRYFQQAAQEIDRLTKSLLTDTPVLDQDREIAMSVQGTRSYLAGIVLAVASVILFGLGCGFALNGVLV